MNQSPRVQSEAKNYSMVDLAQLIMDYENNSDFTHGDLQRGVLIDMLEVVKSNPGQLLEIIPSRPVAKALSLALKRGMYREKHEGELLTAATYYSLTRAMAENPQDLSLYKERYELLQISGTLLYKPLRLASYGLDKDTSCPILVKVKARMLLTDLLHAEEFFKKGVVLRTHRRVLMDQLEKDDDQTPLYQHINSGLEYHERFTKYLQNVLSHEKVWDFTKSTVMQ